MRVEVGCASVLNCACESRSSLRERSIELRFVDCPGEAGVFLWDGWNVDAQRFVVALLQAQITKLCVSYADVHLLRRDVYIRVFGSDGQSPEIKHTVSKALAANAAVCSTVLRSSSIISPQHRQAPEGFLFR